MTAMMTARLALARGQEPADLARPAERLIALDRGHSLRNGRRRLRPEPCSLRSWH